MIWNNPEMFWFLAVIPVWGGFLLFRLVQKKRRSFTFSTVQTLQRIDTGWRSKITWLPHFLFLVSYLLLIAALARPQLQNSTKEQTSEGIDILLSIDISSSMLAEDFKPNRLIASKDIAREFINSRINDRIGITVFARESFTVCPPTVDRRLATNLLETVDVGLLKDGTAIGVGIATSINRLKDSEATSKVLILLTDGMNNAGEIDPLTAGKLASTYGIKIYTLGIGSVGTAPYPIDDPIFGRRYQNVEVNIDEEQLKEIARMTGGLYFRATSSDDLKTIYSEIDRLEKSIVEEIIYINYEDLYARYLLAGFVLLLLGFLTERTLLQSSLYLIK